MVHYVEAVAGASGNGFEHFELGGALVEAAQHFELAAEAARLRGAASDGDALTARVRKLRERLSTRNLTGLK